MMPDQRIDSSHLLNNAGSLLINMDLKALDFNCKIQRHFLMIRVARDLLDQARDMAYTKKYDLSQIPKKLTYLAFELAYEYYDSKPNNELIPYLTAVIAYEKYNHDQSQADFYKELLEKSLEENEKHTEVIKIDIT